MACTYTVPPQDPQVITSALTDAIASRGWSVVHLANRQFQYGVVNRMTNGDLLWKQLWVNSDRSALLDALLIVGSASGSCGITLRHQEGPDARATIKELGI